MSHDQSTLCRTRRWVPDIGFLTTIQNMTEVAKLSAYLGGVRWLLARRERDGDTYHVKMYCVWLFRRFTVGALPIGTPLGSRS